MLPGSPEPTPLVPHIAPGSSLEALRTGGLIASLSTGAADAGTSRLVVATAAGITRELVASTPAAMGAGDWVRCGGEDPARCVLGSPGDGHVVLSRLDASTGKQAPAFYTAEKPWSNFAVSPDGKQVAVVDQSPSLTLVDTTTGNSRTMTTSASGSGTALQSLDFTPDGQTLMISGIAFGANMYGIASVDLNGQGALLPTAHDAWLTMPRVSPDGRHLAFTSMSFDSDVWLLEPR
jgi:WD40 repeat protein